MNIDAKACYQLAEQRAEQYLNSLYKLIQKSEFVPSLTKDIQAWKHDHIRSPISSLPGRRRKASSKGYHEYIRWLNRMGKLESYLDRSISYLFMRDLGKDMNSDDTKKRIKRVVNSLRDNLTKGESLELFNMATIYRMAEDEGIELTLIWVMEKIKTASSHIPEGMDKVHAQRKLIKIIAGVLMNAVEEMDPDVEPKVRAEKLDEAIRIGYYYGLTYPFIDDLLDSKVLSPPERKHYSNWIRKTLMTGHVPELGDWTGEIKDFIRYIYGEFREAFQYIKSHQRPETITNFFEQSYVFFQSQEVDREKDLANGTYTNEELYIPVILKSSSSRSIVHSLINAPEDEGYENRTFYYGIYNQLADDFADMFADMELGAVTPYTYYMKHHEQRPDLINPFELYWAVIYYLIHHVYHADPRTCDIILNRAINGLKRYKNKMGKKKYNEVMELFGSFHPTFNRLIQKMVKKADDVDFFDKLLRDHMIDYLRNEKEQQEQFFETIKRVRMQINDALPLTKTKDEGSIIAAANYSLEGSGKRLRPILAWFMGVHVYRLESSAVIPLLKSLEYMHTASLIFDDLPSQDNAATRRGRPALHETYNTATAELAGLYLTQKATHEQASLEGFAPKKILSLIQYSTKVAEVMCKGQAIDLDSKGKSLTIEELTDMCFYKTGIAFEASLIMPAILAGVLETEMNKLKKFAYHAGIAFQIKDDLLDVEGEGELLGKPTGQDKGNRHSTFVTTLGRLNAKKAMWEHYCLATEALAEMQDSTAFLKLFLNYIVHRDY